MIGNPAVVEIVNVHGADRIERVAALVERHLSALGIPSAFRHGGAGGPGRPLLRVNGTGIELQALSACSEQELSELLRFEIMRMAGRRTVLFVCTGNAIRSQIAEGLVGHLFSDRWAAFSAGTMPMGIQKETIEVMREIGIDLSGRCTKHVDLFTDHPFDRVVILCADAGSRCPPFRRAGVTDWLVFDDPLSPDFLAGAIFFSGRAQLRSLRDQMKRAISAYLAGLE